MLRNIRLVIFGDYKDIDAQPEKIMNISTFFMKNGIQLLPGTFQQINTQYGIKTFERIMFSNSKEKLTVQIGIDNIEISKNISDKIYNLSNGTERFLSNAKKIVDSICAANQDIEKGSRISLVVETLYDKDRIKPIEDLYNTFNGTLPKYTPAETFEWSTRSVKREKFTLSGDLEEVNVVSEVQKASGQVNSFGEIEEFDTIQVRLDINTLSTISTYRIDFEFVEEFILKAFDLFESINSELEVKILDS